jgi:Zn-dependent peptidase ImmA (M78 family)
MVGRQAQIISLYERGEVLPGPDIVSLLAQQLRVPYGFFFEPPAPGHEGPRFYRSLSSATKSARGSCERQYEWLIEIVQYLGRFVRLPAYDVPALALPDDPSQISPEMIESAAEECRRAWGLSDGPISNVAWLLENHGCVVSRFPFESDSLDAFSHMNTELARAFVLLNSDKRAAARSRFDAAHELGHLVLHRHAKSSDIANGARWKELEKQAHRFAGAFLFPQASFFAEMTAPTSFDHFIRLKDKWKCAISMMFTRAKSLGVYDDSTYTRMMIGLGKRGWRTREPLDDLLEPEYPQLLRRSFHLIAEKGVRTVGTMRQELHIAMEDVSLLAGIEPGFLTEAPPAGEIIAIPPTLDPDLPAAAKAEGKVLPFPTPAGRTKGGDDRKA